jgi:hypothetical protein
MNVANPYLSLVVTARNDDHGGNLLGRMQIFVNGWIAQARRHNLSSELIIVEWNPPAGAKKLRDALQWPQDFGPCVVRLIEVPPELHQQYQNATALPLYQMIAKNVGIRRARGRFILATNIDILFSDELVAFLAERQLDVNRSYRTDRYDAMSDVPAGASLEAQLEYCRTHLLRINAREGTFPIRPDGRRAPAKVDIAPADSNFSFGPGWYPPERYPGGKVFRWIDNEATLELGLPANSSTTLRLELEPGPGMGDRSMGLQVFDGAERILDDVVARRTVVRVHLLHFTSAPRIVRLCVSGGGDPVEHDPRILNCRVLSCVLEGAQEMSRASKPQQASAVATTQRAGIGRHLVTLWSRIQALIRKVAESGPLMTITIPVSPAARRAAAFYVVRGGLTGLLRNAMGRLTRRKHWRSATSRGALEQVALKPLRQMVFLHTNACGDFTLAAREHWFDLRGYPEFDQFSMNIDSVFCYALHHGGAAEEVLPDPMRIYHIEHGTGSGWTPEGQAALFERIKAKGLSFVSFDDVAGWASQMRRLNCPIIFNHENWGLADFDLPEHKPRPATQPEIRCAAEPE